MRSTTTHPNDTKPPPTTTSAAALVALITTLISTASAATAHFSLGDMAAVPPLPEPPLWESLLLESPWAMIGLCLVVGFVGFFVLNNRGDGRRALIAAAAGIIAAVAIFGLSATITTDRERISAATRQLIGAAARVEEPQLRELLAEDVRLETTLRSSEIPLGRGRDWLMSAVRSTLGSKYAVKDPAVLDLQAAIDGPNVARAQVRVRVTAAASGVPMLSWWRVDWRRESETSWRATALEPLAIGWGD